MNNTLLSAMLLVSFILLMNLSIYSYHKRNIQGALVFSALLFAMAIHTFGYAFELFGGSIKDMYFWIKFEYSGTAFYPLLIILFASEYTDEHKFANKALLRGFLIANLVTLLLVHTNSIHGLYYSNIAISNELGFSMLDLTKGPWYKIQSLVLLIANLYSIATFAIRLKNSNNSYKKRLSFMLLGVSIPMVIFVIYLLKLGPPNLDITTFSYLFMSIFIGIGLFRYDVLFAMPITHEMVLNTLEEGVLVIDDMGLIIHLNQQIRNFFPCLRYSKVGDSTRNLCGFDNYDFSKSINSITIDNKIYKITCLPTEQGGNICVVKDITLSEYRKKQLEKLAQNDSLTQLHNRRYFLETLEKECNLGSFCIIDIDHFKSINDKYGHSAGDKALIAFSNELKNFFGIKSVCRYGGEEFAIWLEGYSIEETYKKLNEFKSHWNSYPQQYKTTFSAGISKICPPQIDFAIHQADEKLYKAKKAGRNIIIADC